MRRKLAECISGRDIGGVDLVRGPSTVPSDSGASDSIVNTDVSDDGAGATRAKITFWIVAAVRAGAGVGNVWFTIESDAAGSRAARCSATSDKINAADISTDIHRQLPAHPFARPRRGDSSNTTSCSRATTRAATPSSCWAGIVAGGYRTAQGLHGAAWGATPGANGLDRASRSIARNETAITFPSATTSPATSARSVQQLGSDFLDYNQLEKTVQLGVISPMTATTSTCHPYSLPRSGAATAA